MRLENCRLWGTLEDNQSNFVSEYISRKIMKWNLQLKRLRRLIKWLYGLDYIWILIQIGNCKKKYLCDNLENFNDNWYLIILMNIFNYLCVRICVCIGGRNLYLLKIHTKIFTKNIGWCLEFLENNPEVKWVLGIV